MKMFGRSRHKDLRQMDLLEWMSSAAGFPAKTLARQEAEPVLLEKDPGCGSNIIGSSPKFDPNGSSSKTLPLFALEDWTKCSGGSLRSGMMRSGTVYPLPTWALHMSGTASGLLPTPAAREQKDRSKVRVLASLDRGNGVAKRICALGLKSGVLDPEMIVGLHPRFAEQMMGYPTSWTDLEQSEMP